MGSIVMTEIKVDNIVDVAGTGKPNFPVAPTHSSGSALSTINTYQYDTTTRVVTVVSDGGNKYAIDGVTTPTITLLRGVTYTFDVSDSSNSNHPLAFKNAGTSYTTGVTSSGTAGTAGATVTFAVAADAPLTGLTYYCTVHGDGMGSSVTTSDPNNGAMLWDGEVKFYLDSQFKAIGTSSGSSSSGISWGGTRALRFGGNIASSSPATATNTIDYYDISATGNATDFGDLIQAEYGASAASSGTRAFKAGGYKTGSGFGAINNIEYVTVSTPGNATDFGDMTESIYTATAVSDSTRGCMCGGYSDTSSSYTSNIEYITIATTGNATDLGAVLSANRANMAGWNDATRGVLAGGESPDTNQIQYFTIQSSANASDFGDLLATWKRGEGAGDSTRMLIMGGRRTGSGNSNNWSDAIEYITIQTTGNSTDFGDLTNYGDQRAGSSDGTYACAAGGNVGGSISVNIDRVTVQTPGNATDHGDLTQANERPNGASGNAS